MNLDIIWSENNVQENNKKVYNFSSTINGKFNLVCLDNSIEIRSSNDNKLVN